MINNQTFTYKRSQQHNLTVFDLLQVITSEPEGGRKGSQFYEMRLPAYPSQDKPLLIINGYYDIMQKAELHNQSDSFPSDISETELMEMLTEVMSIMLLNKEKADEEFASSMAHFDPAAKLPDSIRAKNGSQRKRSVKEQSKYKAASNESPEDKCYNMHINPYFYSLFQEKRINK